MEREQVESSIIKSVGYDAKEEILEIELATGTIYQYLQVPINVFESFMAAESKGIYYNSIKNNFEYKKIEK